MVGTVCLALRSQFNSCFMAANPAVIGSLIVAEGLVRTAGSAYLAHRAVTQSITGAKRLRSRLSEMPLFGPSKKARAEVARRTRRIGQRMSRQLQFKGVHVFKRNVTMLFTYSSLNGLQTATNTLTPGQGFNFSLGNVTNNGSAAVASAVPGATDLQGLFDAWRIKSVRAEMHISNNSSAMGGLANGLPIICSSVDGNDSAAPTSRGEVSQDSSFRVDRMDDTHIWVRVFRPYTVNGTVMEPRGTWVPTSAPNTPFQGLKLWSEPTGTTATANANVFIYFTITYECKDYN